MRSRSMMKGYVISDKGNPDAFLGYNEQGEPMYVRLVGPIRYNLDIIMAVIFIITSFTALYGVGFFKPHMFMRYLQGKEEIFLNIWVYAWLASLILYLYYIPYALWRKSRENWVSVAHENAWPLTAAVLSIFYLIRYWTGHFYPNDDSYFGTFLMGLFYIFGFLAVTTTWKYAILSYIPNAYWREFERQLRYQREMERKAKAKKKKVQQQKQQSKPQNAPEPQPKHNVQREIKERLKRLKELLDEGLISEEDYKRKKEEILKEL